MGKIKMRLWLSIFSGLSFLGYFTAILITEHAKEAVKVAEAQAAYLNQKTAADEARYQYYQDVAKRRNELKQSMRDAEAKYDQLLKDQPGIITQHQTTRTVTTRVPDTAPTSPAPSKSAAAPKPTRSTKTS